MLLSLALTGSQKGRAWKLLRGSSDSDYTTPGCVQEKLHQLERQVGVDKAALASQKAKVRVEQEKG